MYLLDLSISCNLIFSYVAVYEFSNYCIAVWNFVMFTFSCPYPFCVTRWEGEHGSESGDETALTKMVKYWILWASSQIHPLYFYLDFTEPRFYWEHLWNAWTQILNSSFPKI